MKRLVAVLVLLMVTCGVAVGQNMNTNVQSNPSQIQNTQAVGGGYADSVSNSNSVAVSSGGESFSVLCGPSQYT